MSTLLTAHALHVETAFGPLFNSLSFTLKKGDRIGLIGHNGCGKSTLLQVLDGTLAPEDELELRLRTLTELSLLTLLRLEDEMVMPPEMKFSRRELEILKWTAEGKTSAEVAMILSISENTVNFHQKNMQRKFNAPNKTQIACYAVATGLI